MAEALAAPAVAIAAVASRAAAVTAAVSLFRIGFMCGLVVVISAPWRGEQRGGCGARRRRARRCGRNAGHRCRTGGGLPDPGREQDHRDGEWQPLAEAAS